MATQLSELTAEFVGEKWRSDKEPFDFVIAEARVCDDSDYAKTIILKGNAGIGELRANQVYVFLGKHKQYFNRYKGQNEDQFEFNSFIRQEPVSPEAVISYLKEHGEGHGIGVRRCQKLYELFGTEAISIARDNPERIVEAMRAAKLSVDPVEVLAFSQSLKSEQATERTRLDLTGLLNGRGFMRSIVSAAISKWGIKAGYLIRRDPYKLMRLDNVGAGFKRCDSVYLDLGLPPARRKRQALCAWYSIARDTSGSTWFPIDYPAAFLKANISGAEVNQEEAIELATRAKYLSEIRTNDKGEIDSEGSYRWFAERKNHINEAIIANVVVRSRYENFSDKIYYASIPRFDGYRFASNGTVESCWSNSGEKSDSWRELKADVIKGGYLRVRLRTGVQEYEATQVSHAILEAFVCPRPLDAVACHWDGNVTNNSIRNLRWDTRKSNEDDKKRHGTHQTGSNNPAAKLTEPEVIQIRELYEQGTHSTYDLSAMFNVSRPVIGKIVKNELWSHV